MNVSLRHLRCFIAIVDTASFTQAAARLFTTQSSLTRTIHQFEEEVGLKLFDRTTRRVVLTQDGRCFQEEARRLLREFDSAVGDLRATAEGECGHIRICAVPSVIAYIVAPMLPAFRRAYPNIAISVRDGRSAEVERAVLDGDADFGISAKFKGYTELCYDPVLSDPFGVVCPHDHPIRALPAPLRWSNLGAHEYVALSSDTGIAAVLQRHPEIGPIAGLRDEASSTTSLAAILSIGGRYSILPALAARVGQLGTFVFRELEEPRITRDICLIKRRRRSLTPNSQRILKIMIDTLPRAELPKGAILLQGAHNFGEQSVISRKTAIINRN
jgi:DNA-binding transcriptional LysR family regulator